MKLEYMREFLTLSDELSYSATARRLFISQSSLSKHMATLEADMGVPLLQRTTHHVVLTQNGRETVKTFRRIINQYDTLLAGIRGRAGQLSGRLVVGLLYYSMDDFSCLIPLLRQRYPDVELEWKTWQPHELYQDIINGRTDIGAMPVGEYPDADKLCFHSYAKSGMVAILREEHPLAFRKSVSLDELKGETLIELSDDSCSRCVTRELLKSCGIRFEKVIQTPHIETVASCVRETGGIHLTGENCQKQNSPGVRYVPVSDRAFVSTDAFLYMKDNPNPLIPAFLKEADACFKNR